MKTERTTLVVRSGLGTVNCNGFSDEIGFASRSVRQHSGWQSVTYQNHRYQLHGGIRTPYFICLNSPINR